MKMTINLRKVLFFLLTLCLIGSAYAQDTALKEAEVAYTKEDYAKAIELYEGILKSNGESAAVYYNLGNAYYKAGKIAPAILHYERCLLLDPGDSDARFNLQMARQKNPALLSRRSAHRSPLLLPRRPDPAQQRTAPAP